MGGLREILRELEQGKCGRREAREGGWEVSRIPSGLANALEKKEVLPVYLIKGAGTENGPWWKV